MSLPEKRYDPTDGKLRTFEELHRACSGQYTEKEILLYWTNRCVKHAPTGFEGEWLHGAATNTIEGTMLYWQCGIETHLHVEEEGETPSFSIWLDGASHRATLAADGGSLTWSDGEVWQRQVDSSGDPENGPEFEPLVAPPKFEAGDRVKYWSHRAAKWITVIIKGRNGDGTFRLESPSGQEVKRAAAPELLRPVAGRAGGRGRQASDARKLLQRPGLAMLPRVWCCGCIPLGIGRKASDARWRMQLPRAVAEMQEGQPELFEKLLLARLELGVGLTPDQALSETIQDCIEACPSLGFSPKELEKQLRSIKERQVAQRAPRRKQVSSLERVPEATAEHEES